MPGLPDPKKTYNKSHFYDLRSIASATECTGLIPSVQQDDEPLEEEREERGSFSGE